MSNIKKTLAFIVFLFVGMLIYAQLTQSPATENQTSALTSYELDINSRALLAFTNDEYPVTPGDSYQLVYLRGVTRDSVAATVGTDYSANLGVFGIVSAKGQTFDQFSRSIEQLVSVAYPGSMPQLLIRSTGVFNVIRLGETTTAGEFASWGLMRLSSLFNASRTNISSMRSITVRSIDGVLRTYDLFKAQREGDLSQDPYLKPGDVVTLSRYDRSVDIVGKVQRPGSYQILPGETLSHLIEKYAMGFSDRADLDRIVIERVNDDSSPMGSISYCSYIDSKNLALLNHDTVTIRGLDELLPVVWIDGAFGIDETGEALETAAHVALTFTPGERLSTVVRKIRTSINSASALDESYIRRGEQHIPVNLESYLYDKDFSVDYKLEPNDTIVIPFKQMFITVSGAVKNPGRFPYINDRTWEYYVALAGGFDTEKNSYEAIILLDKSGKAQQLNHIIQPEDSIIAKSNSFLYQFGRVSTILGTTLSLVSLVVSLLGLAK